MSRLLVILPCVLVAALTSGCILYSSGGDSGSGGSSASASQCKADRLQSYVGQKLTSDVEDRFRLQADSMVRFIRPNQAATMDYNASRVNVHLDKNDRIMTVTCG